MAGHAGREIQYPQLLRHPPHHQTYTVITTPKIIMVSEYAGGGSVELFPVHPGPRSLVRQRHASSSSRSCALSSTAIVTKIVHRDLKPENLLLDDALNVQDHADFGLSNIMTDGNFLKTSCGSPDYAAPEVVGGKLYAGPEVDVWSCRYYRPSLCARLPFDDEYIPTRAF